MTGTAEDSPLAGATDSANGGEASRSARGRVVKLVRDRIPEIIRGRGSEPIVRVADRTEFRGLLRAKLVEEVDEFLASGDPEELADVLEVVFALAVDLGHDRDHLEKLRVAKAAERGGFAARLVWAGNRELTGPQPGATTDL